MTNYISLGSQTVPVNCDILDINFIESVSINNISFSINQNPMYHRNIYLVNFLNLTISNTYYLCEPTNKHYKTIITHITMLEKYLKFANENGHVFEKITLQSNNSNQILIILLKYSNYKKIQINKKDYDDLSQSQILQTHCQINQIEYIIN